MLAQSRVMYRVSRSAVLLDGKAYDTVWRNGLWVKLWGQGHYHCAMGELQMAGRGSELLSNVGEYSVLLSGRDHECMSNMSA